MYGDIVRGLPLEAGSVDGVYCSHVLEHLSLNDAIRALDNTAALMKSGAVFRVVVPDLQAIARLYTGGNLTADEFVDELGMGLRHAGLRRKVRSILGNSRHQWMWDEKSLSHALERVGFSNVRRAQMGDADDPAFEKVEVAARWSGCLGMHCIWPG
jgi:predicted SAM-dependent methyltransferase